MKPERHSSSPSRPGFLPTPALDLEHPAGPAGTAWVEIGMARRLAVHGPPGRYRELLTLVRETLAYPEALLPWALDDLRGWCYARRASHACNRAGHPVRPPWGMVFTVCTSVRLVVGDWTWKEADPTDPALPRRSDGHLGEPAWRRTT